MIAQPPLQARWWLVPGLSVLALAAAVAAPDSDSPTTDAKDKPSIALTLNGATAKASPKPNKQLTLTLAQPNAAGSAFLTKAIDAVAFTTEFTFTIDQHAGPLQDCTGRIGGGDGLVFVVQPQSATALGASGLDLGYGGIGDSLAVEFDTFCNPGIDGRNDLSGVHVGVLFDGSTDHANLASPVVVVDPVTLTSFDDSATWTGWIDYNLPKLEVRIARGRTRPAAPTLAVEIPTAKVERANWYGFTSGTGDNSSRHRITGWRLDTVIVPKGSTPPGGPPQPKLVVRQIIPLPP